MNYLTISRVATECEGCGRSLVPGAIGLTDELNGDRLDVQCPGCFEGIDPELVAFWLASDRQLSRATETQVYETMAGAAVNCGEKIGCALAKTLLDAAVAKRSDLED